MSATTIRLKKEARALLWPWLTVVIAALAPAVLPQDSPGIVEAISFLGFFGGIALLATLPLGNEFHYRTLPLWLSQPAGRIRMWAEKLIVSFAAVLSAAAVFGISTFSFFWSQQEPKVAVAAIVWVIVTAASATFWTLVARSTLGGLALNTTVFWLAVFVLFGPEMDPSSMSGSTMTAIFAFGIGYAELLIWLGARKLARLQVTGGSAGGDLTISGAGWFPRCRPTQPFLNLIRKEVRLLRPLWLIALFVVLYLAGLAMFRRLPDLADQTRAPITLFRLAQYLPMVLFLPLMGILAGSLSLGEERTLGTQAWHMTLPVSARRQWLVKLAMAVLAGLACSILLPLLVLIAAGSIFGSPFMFVDLRPLRAWLLVIPLLSLASFWCACASSGTVRAALWVFPMTGAIYFAGTSGMWLGQELARTTGTLMDIVVSWFQMSPLARINRLNPPEMFLLIVPAILLFGVLQSYRLFRTQPQDSSIWMLRCLLPLLAVSIFCGLSVSAGFGSSSWEPFDETRQALAKLRPGTAQIELTEADLAKASTLSGLTRRWLRGSRITVAPDKSHSSGYLATIHLASGVECRLAFANFGTILFSPQTASCM